VIQASGNADGIISFCEGRLARYPFWLDLDRHSSQAYASLGPKAAVMRQTVVVEALSFAQRLEGIELLSFANNMPFANDETRAWLKSCENERSGGNAADGFGKVRHEAMQAFNAGSAEAAVKILQAYTTHAATGFDLFRTKLVIAELAVSMRKEIDQRPFVDPLSDQCTRLSLSSWDSELALDVWRLKLRAARHAMTLAANTQVPSRLLALDTEVAQALMQISMIDMQEAIRLA
jgi:type VI secretion system protein VasJ